MSELDNQIVVEAILKNCLKTMNSMSTPSRSRNILKRILRELSQDYPYLKNVSVIEGDIIIDNPDKIDSVNGISLARSMNSLIHKSVLYVNCGVAFPGFRTNMCGGIESDMNIRIRDAGILL